MSLSRTLLPQFGLRTLLAFVALIAVPLAWLSAALQVRRAERAVCERIYAVGGVVEYEPPISGSESAVPDGWRELLGRRLTRLDAESSADPGMLTDDDVKALRGASALRELMLGPANVCYVSF